MAVHETCCPVCGGRTALVYQGHPSYVFRSTYDIYSCAQCLVSFVYPLFVEQKDYDAIYSDAEYIAGYDKYHALSQRILSAERPLDVMADLGDEYAFVINRLQLLAKKGDPVLEVGCGLGYLTYALHAAGYDARGADLSAVSVRRATETYGSYYQCVGVNDFSSLEGRRFRFIVLTEVIEH
ncbi:MAG: class I SAM-dependent methyltransferase, partial [Chlorobiaceae bacterium]|nr:class I SAM-dependent methyltransferase [Chlorobiaceae bacterium]